MADEIIARLENATGPDRVLDTAIADFILGASLVKLERHAFGSDPRYTASIDAALSLAPGGWRRLLFEQTGQTWGCFLDAIDTNAATHELALCIAALKARAPLTTTEGR